MSINAEPAVKWSLGILASKDFDSPQLLEDLLLGKTELIKHVYTNGANPLVITFAQHHGIPLTIYPVHGGRGLPLSTREVVDASDFVFVVSTPESKSAEQIVKACQVKETLVPAFKWRLVQYDPFTNWREKVGKIEEIMDAMPKDEIAANEWTKAVAGVLE